MRQEQRPPSVSDPSICRNSRIDRNAACPADVRGDSLAQLRVALGGAAVRPALVEGALGFFEDVTQSVEIRLADFRDGSRRAPPRPVRRSRFGTAPWPETPLAGAALGCFRTARETGGNRHTSWGCPATQGETGRNGTGEWCCTAPLKTEMLLRHEYGRPGRYVRESFQ